VNTGDVIAGDVGSAERYEFTILGDAINMARRLESLAGAWEVIAGQATIEALGSSVLHQPLPPTLVKGKDTPVELSLVHGLRVDQGASPERHYDLAVPGQLDLSSSPAGSKPEQTLLSGLRMLRPDALSVEVLTLEDPVPGTLVRLSLRLPRAEKSLVVSGQVLPSATDETLLLGPNLAVSGSGVQRIPLRIQQPRELLAYLRLDPHA